MFACMIDLLVLERESEKEGMLMYIILNKP